MSLDRGEFDPRKLFKEATVAARGICKDRFQAFWSAGNASKIEPVPLEKMVQRYAAFPRAA
jgi:fructose-bisphosphate aldolase, class II